jgi:hypothetical protein
MVRPWIATLTPLPVLFVTVYPVPAWPYSITPYLFLAALILGFGYMQCLEVRSPGALRKGATMLVGSRSTAEGDVDGANPEALLLSRVVKTSGKIGRVAFSIASSPARMGILKTCYMPSWDRILRTQRTCSRTGLRRFAALSPGRDLGKSIAVKK